MDGNLFFPKIERRSNYSTKSNGEYYRDYKHYHVEIAEDCNNRCVYCDIKENEIGFEGFVLDHFRPQVHFPDLISNPKNLVLSCPKCNILKSDHWAIDIECAETHNGICGFLDPFIESRLYYFSIEEDGNLICIKPLAKYLEKIFLLNRYSRKKVRYLRIINHKIERIIIDISKKFDFMLSAWNEKKISDAEWKEFCREHNRKLSLVGSIKSNSQ